LSANDHPSRTVSVKSNVLNPDYTLSSGQAFRWTQTETGEWMGLLSPAGSAAFVTKSGDTVTICATGDAPALDSRRYFRLDDNFDHELTDWSSGHGDEIAAAIDNFPGLRLLRQEVVECLFSFMTSAAAPIHRIRRCMEGLCRACGEQCGPHFGAHEFYHFPTVNRLAEFSREEFDRLGFGFRGGNIRLAAQQVLANGGETWLRDLRAAPYGDAKRTDDSARCRREDRRLCLPLFARQG